MAHRGHPPPQETPPTPPTNPTPTGITAPPSPTLNTPSIPTFPSTPQSKPTPLEPPSLKTARTSAKPTSSSTAAPFTPLVYVVKTSPDNIKRKFTEYMHTSKASQSTTVLPQHKKTNPSPTKVIELLSRDEESGDEYGCKDIQWDKVEECAHSASVKHQSSSSSPPSTPTKLTFNPYAKPSSTITRRRRK